MKLIDLMWMKRNCPCLFSSSNPEITCVFGVRFCPPITTRPTPWFSNLAQSLRVKLKTSTKGSLTEIGFLKKLRANVNEALLVLKPITSSVCTNLLSYASLL